MRQNSVLIFETLLCTCISHIFHSSKSKEVPKLNLPILHYIKESVIFECILTWCYLSLTSLTNWGHSRSSFSTTAFIQQDKSQKLRLTNNLHQQAFTTNRCFRTIMKRQRGKGGKSSSGFHQCVDQCQRMLETTLTTT